MDRHVEFATQLSRLVELYAHHADDHATERSVLRAARAAAKHGAIELSVVDRALTAGSHTLGDDIPDVPMLRDLFVALGITRFHVAHNAKQAEIKSIAHLLADVVTGKTAPAAFAAVLAGRKWAEIQVTLDVATAVVIAEESSPAVAEPVVVEPAVAEPAVAEPAVAEPMEAEPTVAEADVAESPIAEQVTPDETAGSFVASGPLATHVPVAVEQLSDGRHRELFERLITSSEPATLRRLLEPIQLAVEQALR